MVTPLAFVERPGTSAPNSTPTLSVVIPCYNEVDGIEELHRRVTISCTSEIGDSYEVVYVNDGSRDATWRAMEKLSRSDRHVVAIDLARNYGHQIALSAGLRFCQGERILILDADLQDPPELLSPMMRLMDDGAHVVYGQRRRRSGETLFKKGTASAFYRLLGKMAEIDIPPDSGDFRLMSRQVLDVLNAMPERHRFVRGMVSWIGLTQVPLLYDREPRFAGKTNYPFGKMLRLALDAITGFSVKPLRLASYLGLLTSALSVVMIIYTLIAWFVHETIVGWTSIAAIVLAIGSVQLLVLGVLGEYVGRLYMEVKQRPLFAVAQVRRSGRTAETRTDPVAHVAAWTGPT